MEDQLIGRVLRSSTIGYACGTRSNELDGPSFGAFVRTYTEDGSDPVTDVIGLIYAIRIDDDPLVRQLIMANQLNPVTLRDQRENRMIPVEISVVNIGYRINGQSLHNMPPRPARSLDPVCLCDNACIRGFTDRFDFFRLVLNTTEVPSEDLLAAALKHAAAARPVREQREFLVEAGRRLAQLLSHDLARLNHLLRLIKP
ncbi:MAG TPA: hypothetical protein VMT34_08325 [Aggregatilineales bacterium]|nr:hypothetical protein [Aggregatilineales bacterium]